MTLGRFDALLDPADAPRRRGALRGPLARRALYALAFRARSRDSNRQWSHTHGPPIPAADGRATCTVGTHFEITDGRHAKDGRRGSEAYRRNLFEQVSHGVLLSYQAWLRSLRCRALVEADWRLLMAFMRERRDA